MRLKKLAKGTLHRAAFDGDVQAVLHLLNAGADVDERDHEDTSLALAIEHLNDDVVRVLLLRGADPNRRGYGGVTPLQAAIDVAVEQSKSTFDLIGELAPAATLTLELLLEAGADPLQVDLNGSSSVDWAARHQHLAALALLERHLGLPPAPAGS